MGLSHYVVEKICHTANGNLSLNGYIQVPHDEQSECQSRNVHNSIGNDGGL